MLTLVASVLIGLVVAVLAIWRWSDHRSDRAAMLELLACQPNGRVLFEQSMLADLPQPAQRFFRFAINEGTPLFTVAEIDMGGELSLGTRDDPRYQKMSAHQVLAPPTGFVWQVLTGGAMFVTGSDALTGGTNWSRFRVLNAVPVGRAGGSDHRRSSFGRMIGEGLFWTPAAFLPAADAGWDILEWTAAGDNIAVVRVRLGELEQAVEVHVAETGRPLRIAFQRWSNENPERVYRLQPFGGDLDDFRTFDGFNLPTSVVGGNHYGTEHYHPFYRARVQAVRFPPPS